MATEHLHSVAIDRLQWVERDHMSTSLWSICVWSYKLSVVSACNSMAAVDTLEQIRRVVIHSSLSSASRACHAKTRARRHIELGLGRIDYRNQGGR